MMQPAKHDVTGMPLYRMYLLATGHKMADLWWQNIELPRR